MTHRSMIKSLLPCSLVFCLATLSALGAEKPPGSVYKTVDAQGRAVFSDRPTDDAVRVKVIDPINLAPPEIPVSNDNSQGAQSAENAPYRYEGFAIAEPVNEAVIRDNTGNLAVKGTFTPALHPDHQLELLIDAKVYGSSEDATFNLTNIDRGVHSLQLQIVDTRRHQVLQQSETVTFTLVRQSLLHPKGKSKP